MDHIHKAWTPRMHRSAKLPWRLTRACSSLRTYGWFLSFYGLAPDERTDLLYPNSVLAGDPLTGLLNWRTRHWLTHFAE